MVDSHVGDNNILIEKFFGGKEWLSSSTQEIWGLTGNSQANEAGTSIKEPQK